MSMQIVDIPAGYKLALVSNQNGGEKVAQFPDGALALVPAGLFTLGPFADARRYAVHYTRTAPTLTVTQSTDLPLPINATTIAAGRYEVIPADHQLCAFGTLTVNGTLVVNGSLRVAALPALT